MENNLSETTNKQHAHEFALEFAKLSLQEKISSLSKDNPYYDDTQHLKAIFRTYEEAYNIAYERY